MRKYIVLGGLIVLAGCASDQQVCAGFGYAPGTNAFADCMQNRYAQRVAAIQAISAQQQANQQQIYHEQMQAIDNAQRANAIQRPSSSNCYFYGNMMHCNNY